MRIYCEYKDYFYNLPCGLTKIKVWVDKFLFDFVNDKIINNEEIDIKIKDNNYLKNLQRVCEIYDVMGKMKLPFGCEWVICSD